VAYLEIGQRGTYKRGLKIGSPPAGSRDRAPVGVMGRSQRFMEFKLNFVHVIQLDIILKVGLLFTVEIAKVVFVKGSSQIDS